MYVHYAESKHWKVETMEMEEIGIGGMKSVTFMVTGQGAYSVLKYESGVHRVQRVPETESGGRIHTSTITVAVMPEAEDVDVVIDDKDIRIDVCRSSGAGGQCDLEQQKAHDAEAELRKSQVGTGDRSEKIRTYNFPQGRVTDHRINLTLYKLDKIMDGDIQEIIDACIAADQAAKLAKMNE